MERSCWIIYIDVARIETPSIHRVQASFLLDLNMPQKSGREALVEIKSDPRLSRIPIVVLTTSNNANDMFQTSALGVNGFITKPTSFTGYLEMMRNLIVYWTENGRTSIFQNRSRTE